MAGLRFVIGLCVDLPNGRAYPQRGFASMGPAEQPSETDAQFDLQSMHCRAFRPSGREDRCIRSRGERALGLSCALELNPPEPGSGGFFVAADHSVPGLGLKK